MPRKKTKDTVEKKLVTEALTEISVLLEDQVARVVAELVHEDDVSRSKASKVTTVLQATTKDCVNRVRAAKGL